MSVCEALLEWVRREEHLLCSKEEVTGHRQQWSSEQERLQLRDLGPVLHAPELYYRLRGWPKRKPTIMLEGARLLGWQFFEPTEEQKRYAWYMKCKVVFKGFRKLEEAGPTGTYELKLNFEVNSASMQLHMGVRLSDNDCSCLDSLALKPSLQWCSTILLGETEILISK